MNINKETLKEFRRDLKEVMKDVEDKYNIDLSLGSITYEINSFHATLTARKRGLTNAEWKWYCKDYGFSEDDLGKSFYYGRKKYTITGIKQKNKFPIMAQREDGKEFSFTAECVKENLYL